MKITDKSLQSAIRQFEYLNASQIELVVDEIYKTQPNILASVLVQLQMGNTMADVDVLLRILVVIFLALKEANIEIELISEAEQQIELERMVAHIKFTEGLDKSTLNNALTGYIESHNEKIALSYTVNELVSSGIATSNKKGTRELILAGLNIVNCVSIANPT